MCMRKGKSVDENEISTEHLHNAPLLMLQRFSTLFTSMLKHRYVPHQFRLGFMIPLIKDYLGNHACTSNYRGITISPIISKLFEHALKHVFLSPSQRLSISLVSRKALQLNMHYTASNLPSITMSIVEAGFSELFWTLARHLIAWFITDCF